MTYRNLTRTLSSRLSPLVVMPLLAVALGCSTTVSDGGVPPIGGGATGGGAGAGTGGTPATGGSNTGGTGGGGGSSGSGTSGASGTSGMSGSSSAGTTSVPEDGPRPVSMEGAPIYSRFLRLTNDQWENSVHDILKLSAPTGKSGDFLHAVTGTTDFDNNENVVVVDGTAWSDFQSAAEAVAAQVTTTDQALQAVVATTDPATFITTFGRRAFRRDLTTDEITKYQALFTEGGTYTGTQSAFTKGAALVITAMLQSPYFLYRTELGDDGTPLSGYEMAAKLSLWIRDTTPTDAMLDAAKSGSFDSADGAVTQATTMLADATTTKAVVRKFNGQLYKLELFDTIVKTNVMGYDEALLPEFKEASYQFFDYIFSQDLGLKDILTSTVGFAGPAMAKLYGITARGSAIQQVNLPDRSGYYSQAPFLTMWGINNDPDSIHRGVRINLDTLCADPGAPAADLPSVPALEMSQTNRERYDELTRGCGAVCHGVFINPIGFAFENYDGLGRERDMDNGQPVDTTGSYPFAEGKLDFSGAAELMQIMASGAQANQCWAKKMASYALERDLVENDRPLVEALGSVSQASAASLKAVMLALAKNDAFRTRVGGAQ